MPAALWWPLAPAEDSEAGGPTAAQEVVDTAPFADVQICRSSFWPCTSGVRENKKFSLPLFSLTLAVVLIHSRNSFNSEKTTQLTISGNNHWQMGHESLPLPAV